MDVAEASTLLGPRFEVVSKDGALALDALRLPKDAVVLDVGTGSGYFAVYLALRGFDVLTGEPSSDSSHYARKDWALNAAKAGVGDKIRFQAFDASAMPFDSESFDAVFFFGVLHHVEVNLRSCVLQEALRVCKRGGAVVLFEPTKAMLDKIWTDDPGHPLAADPRTHFNDPEHPAEKIDGTWMDIVVYRRP